MRHLCILEIWGLGFFTRNASEPFLNQGSSELGVCFFWVFLQKTEKEELLKMILKYKKYKPTDFLGLWGVVVMLFKCYSLLRETLCKLKDSKAFLRLHLPFLRADNF